MATGEQGVERLKSIIERNHHLVGVQDEQGRLALHVACQNQGPASYAMIKILYDMTKLWFALHKADVDTDVNGWRLDEFAMKCGFLPESTIKCLRPTYIQTCCSGA